MYLVKICGLKSEEAATVALKEGANMLGIILVPNRKRTIDFDVAKSISNIIKQKRIEKKSSYLNVEALLKDINQHSFKNIEHYIQKVSEAISENGPFLVGVFRNQSLDEVLSIANDLDLDFIQLHGSEDKLEYMELTMNKEALRFGIIPRFVLPQDAGEMYSLFDAIICNQGKRAHNFILPLLDTEAGGEGKVIDWKLVEDLERGKFILAGGLNPSNVVDAKMVKNVIGFDVSGGVEDKNGDKDYNKMKNFISRSNA